MLNWKIKEKKEVFMAKGLDFPKVLMEILMERGMKDTQAVRDFLNPNYEKDSQDPFLFSDMEKAVGRIRRAVNKKEKVTVFGDYDADGITASVILKEALEGIGIETSVYIPDKKNEGYGMNVAAIEKLAKDNVKLIITVDCGITNIKEVAFAKKLGIDVIITDHHHIPVCLPEAFAIINPKIITAGYPFAELAGVGVAFKLVQAIFEIILPEKKDQIKWFLDLVAIGTVADCVPLTNENRMLVKYGLLVLSKTKRTGLRQLFLAGGINIDENNIPSTRNIGFHIAPRINAAGRINHANLAYDLLMEKDTAKARVLALELEDNNSNRQKITEVVTNEVKILAENSFKNRKLIFAVSENFPIGIVGLVAGKIAQQFNKPVGILQKGEKQSSGSFRSIPQVNIIEAIEKCGDMLLKFGGHSQAAGISIKNDQLDIFFEKLNIQIEKELADKDISPELTIDAEIEPVDLDFSLAENLEKMKPFGEGNPEPVFCMRHLIIEDIKIIGKGEKHFKIFLRSKDNPKIFEAVGFYMAQDFSYLKKGDIIEIAFNLQKDEWNGNHKVQLILIDIKNI